MAHDHPTMTKPEVDRRTLLTGAAAGIAAGLLAGEPAQAQQNAQRVSVRAEAFAQDHQPKPLPFEVVAGMVAAIGDIVHRHSSDVT